MPLNLVFGLYMLLTNPKPGVSLFSISPIMLHETAGTTQRISSPQSLLCEADAYNIHLEIFINFLESGEEVGFI